jgi:dTDP-4-dehydrorhamnose 3,5-epimerase
MKIIPTELPEVKLLEPRIHSDARGFVMESWNVARYRELGLPTDMAQDNLSWSRRGVLRGMHFQNPNPQAKLIYALAGHIWDVVVDIRVGSPRFGHWMACDLSLENRRQLYIPNGFAHGFVVLSATALVAYKCTDFYRASCQSGLSWNDPQLDIRWPVANPILSEKDKQQPCLAEISLERLPEYEDASDLRVAPRWAA